MLALEGAAGTEVLVAVGSESQYQIVALFHVEGDEYRPVPFRLFRRLQWEFVRAELPASGRYELRMDALHGRGGCQHALDYLYANRPDEVRALWEWRTRNYWVESAEQMQEIFEFARRASEEDDWIAAAPAWSELYALAAPEDKAFIAGQLAWALFEQGEAYARAHRYHFRAANAFLVLALFRQAEEVLLSVPDPSDSSWRGLVRHVEGAIAEQEARVARARSR